MTIFYHGCRLLDDLDHGCQSDSLGDLGCHLDDRDRLQRDRHVVRGRVAGAQVGMA